MSHMCRQAKGSCTRGRHRPTREEESPWCCAVITALFMRARRSARALCSSCSRPPGWTASTTCSLSLWTSISLPAFSYQVWGKKWKCLKTSPSHDTLNLSAQTAMNWTFLFADGHGDTCPKGFILDTASYCAGMLLSFFMPHLALNICYRSRFIIIIINMINVSLLDEDECALQSPCSHSCNNIMGGYSCACPSGFTISTETNTCQGETKINTVLEFLWLITRYTGDVMVMS